MDGEGFDGIIKSLAFLEHLSLFLFFLPQSILNFLHYHQVLLQQDYLVSELFHLLHVYVGLSPQSLVLLLQQAVFLYLLLLKSDTLFGLLDFYESLPELSIQPFLLFGIDDYLVFVVAEFLVSGCADGAELGLIKFVGRLELICLVYFLVDKLIQSLNFVLELSY